MINKGMMSSNTGEWATPQDFFDKLNAEFDFTLDVAATKENSKCGYYFTKDCNGLNPIWAGYRCWMNPPYGDPEYPCKPNCKKKKCVKRGYHNHVYIPGIRDWVKKAAESKTLVVALLPARTDTRWFHDHIYGKAEIRFVKSRLKFSGAKNSAPFPSMVVIWNKPKSEQELADEKADNDRGWSLYP